MFILCLINKSSLYNSFFYNINRLALLIFLDSGDFRKWIITNLNRLMYRKVGFQSL